MPPIESIAAPMTTAIIEARNVRIGSIDLIAGLLLTVD